MFLLYVQWPRNLTQGQTTFFFFGIITGKPLVLHGRAKEAQPTGSRPGVRVAYWYSANSALFSPHTPGYSGADVTLVF